jgi:putative ABC transport system permease protein
MNAFTTRVRQIPGVEHAGLGTSAPFVHWDAQDAFLPGRDTSVSLGGERAAGIAVDDAFLNALGVRVHAGRGISSADGPGASPVVVVTDAMAKALWPGESPIGKCLIPFARTNPCFSVVGVVSDLHQWNLVEAAHMRFFISMRQMPSAGRLPTSLVIRATQDRASSVASLVQTEMRREFPTARIMWPAEPIARKLEPQLRPWRVGAALFAALGTLALFVATIGIYSVIAYSFSQRTHEIGVRMALGARSEDVRALILGEGVRVVSVAAVLGTILSLGMGPLVASLLYGVSSRDPVILAASAIVVVGAGAVAGLLPALKAARVDPVISLRAE